MHIASFDIGKKNFCFYIEEVNEEKLLGCNFNEVFKNGKGVIWKNSDLTANCKPDSYLDDEFFFNMIDLLDEYTDYWEKCEVILVEQQMSFGFNKTNTMALKLAQACITYFQIKYGRTKKIIEFPSYHKTQVLQAPQKMTKPQRKKWSVVKTSEILSLRDDNSMSEFTLSKKKDDLADVLCMLQAYKVMLTKPEKYVITNCKKQKKKVGPDLTRTKYTLPQLKKFTITNLKVLCKKFDCKVSGTKDVVVNRIFEKISGKKEVVSNGLEKESLKKLQEMCLQFKCDSKGTKQVLINRLKLFKKD